MKKILFTLSLIILLGSCKEPPIAQHQLFISFEKDDVFQTYEGTEISIAPRFTTSLTNSDVISTLQSESEFTSRTPSVHNEILTFSFIHIAESIPFPKENIDEIFSKGQKDFRSSHILIVPPDSTFSYIDIRYLIFKEYNNNNNIHIGFRAGSCDGSHVNYFEITETEKILSENGEVEKVIIEADFDILLCSDQNENVNLKNGKLRLLYKVAE